MSNHTLKPGVIYDAIVDFLSDGKLIREVISIVFLGQTDDAGRVCCLIDARNIAKKEPSLIPRLMAADFLTLYNEGVPDQYRSSFIILTDDGSGVMEDDMDGAFYNFQEANLGKPCALQPEPIDLPEEPDYKELYRLPEPRIVCLQEVLDEDSSEAEAWNAGYNRIHKEIISWDQIPDGYELTDEDDKRELESIKEEIFYRRQSKS